MLAKQLLNIGSIEAFDNIIQQIAYDAILPRVEHFRTSMRKMADGSMLNILTSNKFSNKFTIKFFPQNFL